MVLTQEQVDLFREISKEFNRILDIKDMRLSNIISNTSDRYRVEYHTGTKLIVLYFENDINRLFIKMIKDVYA